jgi:hypothetical protein
MTSDDVAMFSAAKELGLQIKCGQASKNIIAQHKNCRRDSMQAVIYPAWLVHKVL